MLCRAAIHLLVRKWQTDGGFDTSARTITQMDAATGPNPTFEVYSNCLASTGYPPLLQVGAGDTFVRLHSPASRCSNLRSTILPVYSRSWLVSRNDKPAS